MTQPGSSLVLGDVDARFLTTSSRDRPFLSCTTSFPFLIHPMYVACHRALLFAYADIIVPSYDFLLGDIEWQADTFASKSARPC